MSLPYHGEAGAVKAKSATCLYGSGWLWSGGGRGIPAEAMERVFEPFYMVDKSRSKKNGGIGLGLTLVERIVEAHSITIAISSEMNTGTSVKLIWDNIDN